MRSLCGPNYNWWFWLTSPHGWVSVDGFRLCLSILIFIPTLNFHDFTAGASVDWQKHWVLPVCRALNKPGLHLAVYLCSLWKEVFTSTYSTRFKLESIPLWLIASISLYLHCCIDCTCVCTASEPGDFTCEFVSEIPEIHSVVSVTLSTSWTAVFFFFF